VINQAAIGSLGQNLSTNDFYTLLSGFGLAQVNGGTMIH